MFKFIKVHEVTGHLPRVLWLNAAHIQHICLGNKGKDVHIRMSEKSFFFVKESMEQIEAMLIPKSYMLETDEEFVARLV